MLLTRQPMAGGGWLALIEDITERRRAEAEIVHLARHDVLTGLANRAEFNARLEEASKRLKRNGGSVTVMMIDLDKFKAVNDTHGPSRRRPAAERSGAPPAIHDARHRRAGAAWRRRIRHHPGRRPRAARRRDRARASDHRGDFRPVRSQRPRGQCRHQHRHRDGAGTRRRTRRTAQARRPRALRRQVSGRNDFRMFRRHAGNRAHPAIGGKRIARRHRAGAIRAALPAGGRRQDARNLRRRGAGALAASGQGHDRAGPVHSARRIHRPDRAARRMDPHAGLRRRGQLAGAYQGRRQHLGHPVQEGQPVRTDPGDAGEERPAAGSAGARDHRNLAARKPGSPSGHDPPVEESRNYRWRSTISAPAIRR